MGDGEWKLWREGEPFVQRFSATFSDDGNTTTGRWKIAEDGINSTTDFDLVYRRADDERDGPGQPRLVGDQRWPHG